MTSDTNRKRGSGIIAGIIIVVIGALFLADNILEVEAVSIIFDYWPVALVVWGAWLFVSSGFRSRVLPLAFILVGVGLTLSNIGIIPELGWGVFWPAILILIGTMILFGSMRARRSHRHSIAAESSSTGTIESVTVMGEARETAPPEGYSGGEKTVVMGSAHIDLRNATLTQRPVTLNITVVMGEAKLRLPQDWAVRADNTTVAGETKDTRTHKPDAAGAPDLIITGTVLMGSLQIEN